MLSRGVYRGPIGMLGCAIVLLCFSGCSTPAQKEARFLETGKRLMGRKDYQRAALQFKNAVQVAPKKAEPHYQLALAYLALGGLQQAVGELRKANELDPKHTASQLQLAELMAASADKAIVEEARKRVEGVLAATPDDPEALAALALTKLRLGGIADAEQDLLKALEKSPAHLRSSMLLASLKLSKKDVAGAEQVMREAVQKNPKSSEAIMALGQLYRVLQRYPEAEAQFQKALQIDKTSGAALVELGAVEMMMGKKDLAEQAYRQAAAAGGREYQTIHAQFLLSQGQIDPAISELKDLTRKDPKDRVSRNLLVGVYLANSRVAEATKVLSDALARNPKDIDALVQRARVELLAGQFDNAQKDLLPVLRLQPDMAEAHHLLARVYRAQGASGNYKQELEEAVQRNPQYLNARLELASLLISSKAGQAALDLMDQTPPAQKSAIAVIVQRNGALMVLGRWDEAEKGVADGLKIGRAPDLLIQDALAKLRRNDAAGARKAAEEVLGQDPENVRALDLLGHTYQGTAGLRKIQEYGAQHPKSARIQQYLGAVLLRSGQPVEARAAFVAAKAASPNDPGVDLDLAQLDLVEKRFDEARKTLTAVLARDAGNTPARILLGGLETQAGNAGAAISQYRQVLEKDARNVMVLNNLAYLLADRANELDEALKNAQQAKELAPGDPAVDDTLGWVYYRKGLYRVAVQHLESAAAKDPSARRKYHLAMTYLKLGEVQRGREQLNAALKMDPTLPEAEAALRMAAEAGGAAKR
jgi:tetratricopeptide (TPR) repeat protein